MSKQFWGSPLLPVFPILPCDPTRQGYPGARRVNSLSLWSNGLSLDGCSAHKWFMRYRAISGVAWHTVQTPPFQRPPTPFNPCPNKSSWDPQTWVQISAPGMIVRHSSPLIGPTAQYSAYPRGSQAAKTRPGLGAPSHTVWNLGNPTPPPK